MNTPSSRFQPPPNRPQPTDQPTNHPNNIAQPPQVGLLITDSNGATATAKKTFYVNATATTPSPYAPTRAAAATATAQLQSGPAATPTPGTASSGSGAASGNAVPRVMKDLSFVGFSGGAISIAGAVQDPDPGDKPKIKTSLISANGGDGGAAAGGVGAVASEAFDGSGEMVSLVGVPAGDYTLLITADDGHGGVAAGVSSVKVFPGELMATAAQSASGGDASAPGGAAGAKLLPGKAVAPGARGQRAGRSAAGGDASSGDTAGMTQGPEVMVGESGAGQVSVAALPVSINKVVADSAEQLAAAAAAKAAAAQLSAGVAPGRLAFAALPLAPDVAEAIAAEAAAAAARSAQAADAQAAAAAARSAAAQPAAAQGAASNQLPALTAPSAGQGAAAALPPGVAASIAAEAAAAAAKMASAQAAAPKPVSITAAGEVSAAALPQTPDGAAPSPVPTPRSKPSRALPNPPTAAAAAAGASPKQQQGIVAAADIPPQQSQPAAAVARAQQPLTSFLLASLPVSHQFSITAVPKSPGQLALFSTEQGEAWNKMPAASAAALAGEAAADAATAAATPTTAAGAAGRVSVASVMPSDPDGNAAAAVAPGGVAAAALGSTAAHGAGTAAAAAGAAAPAAVPAANKADDQKQAASFMAGRAVEESGQEDWPWEREAGSHSAASNAASGNEETTDQAPAPAAAAAQAAAPSGQAASAAARQGTVASGGAAAGAAAAAASGQAAAAPGPAAAVDVESAAQQAAAAALQQWIAARQASNLTGAAHLEGGPGIQGAGGSRSTSPGIFQSLAAMLQSQAAAFLDRNGNDAPQNGKAAVPGSSGDRAAARTAQTVILESGAATQGQRAASLPQAVPTGKSLSSEALDQSSADRQAPPLAADGKNAPLRKEGAGGEKGDTPSPSTPTPTSPQKQQAARPAVAAPPTAARPPLRVPATFAMVQGSTIDMGAAATGMLELGSGLSALQIAAGSIRWELYGSSSKKLVAAVDGGQGRFNFGAPGRFDLRLTVPANATAVGWRDAEKWVGKQQRTGLPVATVTVGPQRGWKDGSCPFITPACGEIKAREFSPITLSCPGLSYPAGQQDPYGDLSFTWKILSAVDGTVVAEPKGRSPKAGPLPVGLYVVHMTVKGNFTGRCGAKVGGGVSSGGGGGGGASTAAGGVSAAPGSGRHLMGSRPAASDRVLFWATLMEVAASGQLPPLTVPRPPCAGGTVQLQAPALKLPAGHRVVGYSWRANWVDGKAAKAAASLINFSGGNSTLKWKLQPGRTDVNLTLTIADSEGVQRQLLTSGSVKGPPCIQCKQNEATLAAAPTMCRAVRSAANAAKLLVIGRPPSPGVVLSFKPDADTSPGSRALTIIATTPVSKVSASCQAPKVTVKDATPPISKPHSKAGVCAVPGTGKWACWTVAQMLAIKDNCEGKGDKMAFAVMCGQGGSLPAGDCVATADGRTCVRVSGSSSSSSSGLTGKILVKVRDGYGNVAAPVAVAVTVHSSMKEGCMPASLEQP